MTKEQILKDYEVDSLGFITTPGKFEGEPLHTPFFYDQMLNGEGELLYDDSTLIKIIEDDRIDFPDLERFQYTRVVTTDDGFVLCYIYNNLGEALDDVPISDDLDGDDE